MTDAAQPAVLVARSGNVAVITINRPEARNAVNGAVSIDVGTRWSKPNTTPKCGPW